MRRVAVVAPHPLARTGGSIYNRRISGGLRQLGWRVDTVVLDDSFPYPTPAALDVSAALLESLPPGTTALIDSLALGAMPSIVVATAKRRPVVALMHLPLAADVSLDADTAARFEEAERRALAAATIAVVTGPGALPLMERFGLAPHRLRMVQPGTDAAPLARGSGGARVELLCVATLNRIKGHDVLLEALARVPADWHLTCAGSLTRDTETVARVRATIARLELVGRVTLAGDLDEAALAELYDRSDVAVLATQQETYGMAAAEALARGLPVVTTTTGALPALVGDEAGILVAPGDMRALADALTRVIGDRALRARLAAGARNARSRLRTWDAAAAEMDALLAEISDRG
jgi:glycosyltransferase involved in cell wall biosynthesis